MIPIKTMNVIATADTGRLYSGKVRYGRHSDENTLAMIPRSNGPGLNFEGPSHLAQIAVVLYAYCAITGRANIALPAAGPARGIRPNKIPAPTENHTQREGIPWEGLM